MDVSIGLIDESDDSASDILPLKVLVYGKVWNVYGGIVKLLAEQISIFVADRRRKEFYQVLFVWMIGELDDIVG